MAKYNDCLINIRKLIL